MGLKRANGEVMKTMWMSLRNEKGWSGRGGVV